MRDYEGLVKQLRSVKDTWQTAEEQWMLDAADALEELELACSRYEKDYKDLCAYLPRWIPTSERLPEVNKYVLGCFRDNSMTAVRLFDIDEHMTFWRACTDEGWETDCDCEPTHWMPLPKPPKEEQP